MKEEADRLCNYFIPEILEKYMIQANLVRSILLLTLKDLPCDKEMGNQELLQDDGLTLGRL